MLLWVCMKYISTYQYSDGSDWTISKNICQVRGIRILLRYMCVILSGIHVVCMNNIIWYICSITHCITICHHLQYICITTYGIVVIIYAMLYNILLVSVIYVHQSHILNHTWRDIFDLTSCGTASIDMYSLVCCRI